MWQRQQKQRQLSRAELLAQEEELQKEAWSFKVAELQAAQGSIHGELERAELEMEETQNTVAYARETFIEAQTILVASKLKLEETARCQVELRYRHG